MALVPTIGLASFVTDEALNRREAAQVSEALETRTEFVSQLVEFRFSLSQEQVPSMAIALAPMYGISVDAAEKILGLPLTERLADTRAEVDRLLAELPAEDPAVAQTATLVQGLRADMAAGKLDSVELLYERFRTAFEPLDDLIVRTNNSIWQDLPNGLDLLEIRANVSQMLKVHRAGRLAAEQFSGYFKSAVDGFADDRMAGRIELAETTAKYTQTTADFDTELVGLTSSSWKAVRGNAAVTVFESEVDKAVAGKAPAFLEDVDYMAVVIRSGLLRMDRHRDVLRAATRDVQNSALTTRAEALSAFASALLVLFIVLGVSLIVVYYVGRSITRPLQRLARYATAVSGGDVHAEQQRGTRGPIEVEMVAQALAEVVANLKAIDAHSLALASGDLEDPVLTEPLPGRLGQSLQASVQALTQSIADREELHRRLAHETTHDGLTGLPNRSAAIYTLETALARATRRGTGLAALFVDLDDFKRINDTYGQATGDEVLRESAKRLLEIARSDDTVARLGSDEFLVVADGMESIHQVVLVAERVVEALALPFTIGGVQVQLAASVGISLSLDGHASGDSLVREADLAVHRAKGNGRGRIEIFDTAMREEVDLRTDIESRLVDALRNSELTVYLQPVVSAEALQIQGFEALVRWRDADGRFIPPDEFIPVAEASDLILELDRYVLQKAMSELASWPTSVYGEDLHVAINVSGRHLVDRSIVPDVAAALAESGLAPHRLVLEITETVLLSDMPVACGHLEQLRAMGITIALDDFGSGYTSLATLRFLPVDILKIDRSIVNELQPDRGQSLVRLIIEAAHEFGMTVVAEGVEHEMQRELLHRLGCEQVQGWLFSPAVEPGRARELVAPVVG